MTLFFEKKTASSGSWMNPFGNIRGATAKSLPRCKVVSRSKIRGVPLEAISNNCPRQMIVHGTQVSRQNSAYRYEGNVKSPPKGAILLFSIVIIYVIIYEY